MGRVNTGWPRALLSIRVCYSHHGELVQNPLRVSTQISFKCLHICTPLTYSCIDNGERNCLKSYESCKNGLLHQTLGTKNQQTNTNTHIIKAWLFCDRQHANTRIWPTTTHTTNVANPCVFGQHKQQILPCISIISLCRLDIQYFGRLLLRQKIWNNAWVRIIVASRERYLISENVYSPLTKCIGLNCVRFLRSSTNYITHTRQRWVSEIRANLTRYLTWRTHKTS